MPDLSRTMCEPASHASHDASHASQGASHASHKKKVSSIRHLLNSLLFSLTCFDSIVNGTKRLLRIIEGLKKSGAVENRDSTVIFKIVGKL